MTTRGWWVGLLTPSARCSVVVEHPDDMDLTADRIVYVRDSGLSLPGVQLQDEMDDEPWTFPHHTPPTDPCFQAFERLAAVHGWACAPPAPDRSTTPPLCKVFVGTAAGSSNTTPPRPLP